MSLTKSSITIADVQAVLQHHWKQPIENVSTIGSGNFSSAFSFEIEGCEYVIRFSEALRAFELETYIADILSSQSVPYPKIIGHGEEGNFKYCISERMKGTVVADLETQQKAAILPDIIRVITDMHQVRLDNSASGYGFISPDGNGSHENWDSFIISFYDEDQTGTFWENWHQLFRESCLEREVFEEIYARLLTFSEYNAPYRHFVHGDCHLWNLLSDGDTLTGIIDCNAMYGDFVIDIVTLKDAFPEQDVAGLFRDHYEKRGIDIPYFNERLAGAHYFKGLDAMRFYAKQGWNHAYIELRDRLLSMSY